MASWNNAEARSQEAIQYYVNNNIKLADCAKMFNLAYCTLSKYLNKAGHTRDSFRKGNFEFFKNIDTEEKAYWLGFLLADGCVVGHRLQLRLSIEDVNHLEQFREHIGFTDCSIGEVHGYQARQRKRYHACDLVIQSPKIIKDLARHNLVARKTACEKPSIHIPKHLEHHYIRGMFDGDGWIIKGHRTTHGGKYHTDTWEAGICMGAETLNYVMSKICSATKIKPKPIKGYNGTPRFRMAAKKDIGQFMSYIYKDATVCLQRKYDIAKELL